MIIQTWEIKNKSLLTRVTKRMNEDYTLIAFDCYYFTQDTTHSASFADISGVEFFFKTAGKVNPMIPFPTHSSF